MKINSTGIAFFFAVMSTYLWATSQQTSVRQSLDAFVTADLSEVELKHSDHVMEFGFLNWRTAAHTNLSVVVSNAQQEVLMFPGSYATNQVERLALFSTGWSYGDEYYLSSLECLLDAAIAGRVTSSEVVWFCTAHHDEDRLNCLASHYQSAGVSNIVDKYERVLGDTNYCNRIRSGASKRAWDEYKAIFDMQPLNERDQ